MADCWIRREISFFDSKSLVLERASIRGMVSAEVKEEKEKVGRSSGVLPFEKTESKASRSCWAREGEWNWEVRVWARFFLASMGWVFFSSRRVWGGVLRRSL